MSEAMTNREIEDVLTSIRRLVSQDGTGSQGGHAGDRSAEARCLVLTEAQRVIALSPPDGASHDDQGGAAPTVCPRANGQIEPASPDDEACGENAPEAAPEISLPEPNFGALEATIAQLEAAVSASGENWEPEDAPDAAPRLSNVTDLYGRLTFAHQTTTGVATPEERSGKVVETEHHGRGPLVDGGAVPGASSAADAAAGAVPPAVDDAHAARRDPKRADDGDEDPAGVEPVMPLPPLASDGEASDGEASDGEARDWEAGDWEAGDWEASDPTVDGGVGEETILDEDTLRALVAQIVREELHGQLGERITQQVRKLVRAEVARALDDLSYR